MIDFDLSYVYLGAILFLALGGMLSNSSSSELKLKSKSAVIHKSFPASIGIVACDVLHLSSASFSE
jgi:hypothetical protein